MPSRRLIIIGALVLVPAIAFGVARFVLEVGDSTPIVAGKGTTTSAEPTTTSPDTTSSSSSTSSTTSTTGATSSTGSALPSIPRPGEPVASRDAAGLADQIRTAEAAIDDPNTTPAELVKQTHIQQVAYRALVNDPKRKDATLALLDADLRARAEANITAGAKLRSMITKPRDALPAWRIVTPAPADELLGYYRASQDASGVPWYYLASIHLVETRMGRIRGNSDAGAQGPMQFLPATWGQYGDGGDIQSNRDSIMAAGRLLKRNGAPGDMRNAIYNYNHDNRYVDAVIAYAEQMRARERAYFGYHGWQVYYVTVNGDLWLPEGFVGPAA